MYTDRKKQGQEGKAFISCRAATEWRRCDGHNRQEMEIDETAQSEHDRGHLRR